LKSSARDGVQVLTDIGARVEFNPKTHEKLCVIDNSIVWYGSLNILSQYESSESMMRFVGEATARQLLKDVGLRVENVLKPTSFNSIHDGMRGITTTGKLIHIDPVQVRRKRNGPTLKFAEAVLESEGNECNLILWDAETDLVDVGDTVRIINGYTKEFDGKVSLQSGKFGKIEVLQPNNGKKA
jgi:replication factor A1